MSLIEQTRKQFTDRLEELRPMVDEFHQIEHVLGLMDGNAPTKADDRPRRKSEKATKPKAKGGRPKKSDGSTRADEFLRVIEENPGITVTEAAKTMGIKPNYLYRLKRELVDAGKLDGEEKGLVLTGSVADASEAIEGEVVKDDDDGFHDTANDDGGDEE